MPRARRDAARRAVESPASVLVHRALGLLLAGYAGWHGVLFCREAFASHPRFTPAEAAVTVPFWCAVLLGGVFVSARARWALRRSYEAVRARAVRTPPACLQCGYRLVGLSVEPGGRVVCPECGAA